MTAYLYYPGCSAKATSRAYEEALRAIAPRLGIELEEVPDWNCCGASMVVAVNKVLALTLAARNLALAEPQQKTVMTPCPSCNLSMAKANHVLHEGGPLAEKVQTALEAGGLHYGGSVQVRHLLDVLANDVGIEKIKAATLKPLTGIKVAPYYGCQLIRPHAPGDDENDPQNLERIIAAIGGAPAAFPLRMTCCGGTLAITRPEAGQTLCTNIFRSIYAAGADAVVTPCGLCQTTLEVAQEQAGRDLGVTTNLPIFNLPQLVGQALGLEAKVLGLQRSLTRKKQLTLAVPRVEQTA
jgi:heterodisulfide reductase subunit B2